MFLVRNITVKKGNITGGVHRRSGTILSKPSVDSLKVPSAKDMPGKVSAVTKGPPSHSSKSNTLSSKVDRYAGLKKTGSISKAFASTEKRILQENDATAAQEAMYALDGLNVKIARIYKGTKYKIMLLKIIILNLIWNV